MNDVEDFVELVRRSAEEVEPPYFLIQTMYPEGSRSLERVFCYELYHKMRCNITDGRFALSGLVLNAEVVKSRRNTEGSPFRGEIPDFIFHEQASMENNLIVVEVKGSLDDLAKVKHDFKKLERFISEYGYSAGIFLLFNHSLSELRSLVGDYLTNELRIPRSKDIYIITIETCGQPCVVNKLSSLIQPG